MAYNTTAVGETLGGSGLLLEDNNPVVVAEVINKLITNKEFSKQIVNNEKLRLNDFDNDAAGRVFDYLVDNIGDDEDGDEIDNFVFGKEAEESMFDAVYKKKIVVRDGKKVKLNKRISGTVKLTGAQKAALKKARMKAHNAGAKIKRLKSMKLRKRLGLK